MSAWPPLVVVHIFNQVFYLVRGQGKTAEGNVGLAFLFVFLAGLSTTIGSTFAFCSNLADQRFLASALGCSAGVMLYVSFGEIFMIKVYLDAFVSTRLETKVETKSWALFRLSIFVLVPNDACVLVLYLPSLLYSSYPYFF